MPTIQNPRDYILVLNGEEVTGFSDADDALMFEDRDAWQDPRIGMYGNWSLRRNPDQGGNLTIRLLADSDSVPRMVRADARTRSGDAVFFNGYAENEKTGERVELAEGVMRSSPPFSTVGASGVQDKTFVFQFKNMQSVYEGVRYDPMPRDGGVASSIGEGGGG